MQARFRPQAMLPGDRIRVNLRNDVFLEDRRDCRNRGRCNDRGHRMQHLIETSPVWSMHFTVTVARVTGDGFTCDPAAITRPTHTQQDPNDWTPLRTVASFSEPRAFGGETEVCFLRSHEDPLVHTAMVRLSLSLDQIFDDDHEVSILFEMQVQGYLEVRLSDNYALMCLLDSSSLRYAGGVNQRYARDGVSPLAVAWARGPADCQLLRLVMSFLDVVHRRP
jgi:hypothetical protein